MPARSNVVASLDEGLAALLDRRVLTPTGEPRDDREADEALVSVTSMLLREVLAARRRRGLGGWHAVRKGLNGRLKNELKSHVAEGRMVEATRLAAIIHLREHLYGKEA